MTCAEFEVILSDYVDGAVSLEQRREVEAHADNCLVCRELLRDVFQAVAFLENAERPTPPAELITRLVYHAPKGRVRGELERQSWLGKLFTRWVQPALQPRMAMSMAMTILSFAMLGKCTGVRLQQITPADLNPVVLWNNLEDKSLRTWDRTVKYYENLRLVFEMETRLKEMREQQDEAPAGKTPSQNGADRNGARQNGNGGGTRQ
jgi:anti-sigma-K factor RskA